MVVEEQQQQQQGGAYPDVKEGTCAVEVVVAAAGEADQHACVEQRLDDWYRQLQRRWGDDRCSRAG